MISNSKEDYLETIYNLSTSNNGVRITDIANKLNVTKVSANNYVKRLVAEGCLTHKKYSNVFMTEKGIEEAKLIIKKHNTIKRFLIDILHVPEGTANEDACKIEHVISEITLKKIEEFYQKT